ncbi:hypothetical protein, partial [Actinomadura roseirufa]|uniref:hypothetical protein n=1 Tax=Actinomadura roseirufa TaxID=2094049 RepID=UPI00104146AF
MVFLGFLFVAAAITLGAGVVAGNSGPAHLTAFGQTVPAVDHQWQVFAAGAVTAGALLVGVTLTFAGAGRMMRARRDLRYLREEHEETLTTLEMEKRHLQRELARAREAAAREAAARTADAPAQ